MKVTYNWLKDFVDIKISPALLADKLTMAGLEVTSVEEKQGDTVFEIEITSNRPDWLSVIGIAREVAAITGKKLSGYRVIGLSGLNPHTRTPAHPLDIRIENKKDCSLYIAKIIKNIKVGPSPDWLSRRLELIGCRSVNNIVDITNYCLFETGEPLHAFDLDKIVSQPASQLEINIRRARSKEEIITIDGITRTLDENILIIASGQANRPIAIAGVMGGKDSEVTGNTKNILLEAAVFNPMLIRKSRQLAALQSESAYRFERSVNPDIVSSTSSRAAELINQLAGGNCILSKSLGITKSKAVKVTLGAKQANKILAVNITTAATKKILNNLGFKVASKGKNNFLVEVPAHRQDVNSEIDLIEEIARIYGFDKIPSTLPKARPQVTAVGTRDLVSLVKNTLVGLGLNEVITYSLVDGELLKIFAMEKEGSNIGIMNPLSEEQEILRPSLIPSLARCVAKNFNQKQDCVNIFEIAKAFSDGQPKEELCLGIALSGARSLLLEQGLIKDSATSLHLKGILEVLLERLGIKDYDLKAQENSCSFDIFINKEKIGVLAEVKKEVLDKLDIKNKGLFVMELCLDKVFARTSLKKKFTPLAKYPGISRDISFILKQDIAVKDILSAVEEKGRPLLIRAGVADYYRGKQIPPGFRGLTISCFYRSNERTLTESEINPIDGLIRYMLSQKFEAKIR